MNVYELNRLDKFLRSPYFNKRQELIDLYAYLHRHVKKKKPVADKITIWAQVFGNQNFDDNRFRQLCNYLLQRVQEFLAIENYQKNNLQQANNLLDAVYKQDIKDLVNTSIKTARRLSDRSLHRSSDYYFEQFVLEHNYYNLTQFEIKRRSRSNIQEIIRNLDYFYLAAKLRSYCNLLIRQQYTAYEYETLFIDEIIHHIEKTGYENVPAIDIYFNVFKMITEEDNQKYFDKLQEQINRSIDLFPDNEALDLYHFLLNFCVSKVNTGKIEYYQKMLNIYKSGIDREILLSDGILAEWDFKNIVVVALRLEQYDWVENFIREKSSLLDPAVRQNAVRFNKARLHFYRNEFKEVLHLLRSVEFSDFSYNLSSKAMLLATYYETDEIEALLSFMKSFKTFLNRSKKKLPQNKIDIYLNEIKYIKRLLKIKYGDKKAIKKFKEDLEKEKNIADIRWLNEKINELE